MTVNLNRLFNSAIFSMLAGLLLGFILIPWGKSAGISWLLTLGDVLMWALVAVGVLLLFFWAYKVWREEQS